MTKSHLLALTLAAAAGTAFAEGPLNYPDSDARPHEPVVSTLTRAEVIAEMFAARARGENALTGEDSGSAYLAQQTHKEIMLARQKARALQLAGSR